MIKVVPNGMEVGSVRAIGMDDLLLEPVLLTGGKPKGSLTMSIKHSIVVTNMTTLELLRLTVLMV